MGKLLRQSSDVVGWPRACLGCGSSESGELQEFPFQFRGERQGFGVKYYARVGVNALLCPNCVLEAKHRSKSIFYTRLGIFIPHLILMILTVRAFGSVLMSMSTSFHYVLPSDPLAQFWIIIGGLIFSYALIISLVGGVSIFDILLLQRNPAKRFLKIAIRGGGIRYLFDNDLFANLFKADNYGADVRVTGKKSGKVILNSELPIVEKINLPVTSPVLSTPAPKPVYSVSFGPTQSRPTQSHPISSQPIQSQPTPPPATKFCPQCNVAVTSKAKFCNKCGFKFRNVTGDAEEL